MFKCAGDLLLVQDGRIGGVHLHEFQWQQLVFPLVFQEFLEVHGEIFERLHHRGNLPLVC